MKKISLIALLLINTLFFAQNKLGYWDNVRITNETISLRAGEKKYIKTAPFPEGTTEVVFRITLLDDNQKISSSLVSLLKAIPDPSGISQGSAGAVFLVSTIAGDDTCKFGVFTTETDTKNFVKTGNFTNACYTQDKPVNKDAKLLSSQSNCKIDSVSQLYFAFESNNWVMSEKVLLEVVPWVDNKLSSGWTNTRKNQLIEVLKKVDFYNSLQKRDEFVYQSLQSITKQYTYTEYSKLLDVEKKVILQNVFDSSLQTTGEIDKYYTIIRSKANSLFNNGKIDEAVALIQNDIFTKKRNKAIDYYTLAKYFIIQKKFDKVATLLEPVQDSKEVEIQLALAHFYMFTNKINEAKEIHKAFKTFSFVDTTWAIQTQKDLQLFEKCGLPSDNFKKIRNIF